MLQDMKDYLISASILSADFANLGEEVSKVISAGVDLIHFDVMDNHYVPNLSMGSMILRSLRKYGITIPIDVHLMAEPVDNLILDFARSGASFISFHVEATNHIDRSLQLIKEHGCKSGVAFNPSTPLILLEYIIEKIDMIVLMSVNPGFGGQEFLPVVIDKIKKARRLINDSENDVILAVDGGIKFDNIASIFNAGAGMFIVGSEIFNQSDYQVAIDNLHNVLLKNIL